MIRKDVIMGCTIGSASSFSTRDIGWLRENSRYLYPIDRLCYWSPAIAQNYKDLKVYDELELTHKRHKQFNVTPGTENRWKNC